MKRRVKWRKIKAKTEEKAVKKAVRGMMKTALKKTLKGTWLYCPEGRTAPWRMTKKQAKKAAEIILKKKR